MRETDGQATSYIGGQRVIRASEKRKEKSGYLERRVVPPLHRGGEGLSVGQETAQGRRGSLGIPRISRRFPRTYQALDLLPVPPDLPGSMGILTARGQPDDPHPLSHPEF